VSDLLGIAGNAVTAYQLALGTVSNNIANVSTDGYTRQAVELNAGTPRQLGTAYIGTGVVFDRVKRQYDAFAESNLRNSTSELYSQSPVVDYANRVIDLMGSETAGLTSSLDQFFSAARSLTTDPASTVLRGELYRGAQGVAARFGEISSQLDLVDTETREAVASSLGEVNTISQQLAAINAQMAKVGLASRQPSELLDQRDRLLRQLSELVGIRTAFEPSGAVTVALGGTINRDVIVSGTASVRVGYTSNVAAPERIGLMYDPYGPKPALLTGVTSGKLAGLLTFRDQVLESTRDALDFLAKKFVGEVNAQHRAGVDAYGQAGGDLFSIDPAAAQAPGGISVAIDDPMRLAAAAQFRVTENSTNTGLADATVTFKSPVYEGPQDLNAVLVNNPHPSAAKNFQLGNSPSLSAVATVPGGTQDVAIYLNEASGNQQLQLVTRDGRHLLGKALTAGEQAVMLLQPGLTAGASYSSQYLGVSGSNGYKDMDVFYGARAEKRAIQRFDALGNAIASTPAPAQLTTDRLGSNFTGFSAGTFKFNGLNLPELSGAGASVQAGEVASWIYNWAQGLVPSQGISARAFNEIYVPASSLNNANSLEINGVLIVRPSVSPITAEAWMDAINAQSSDVLATVSTKGELVLTNASGLEGQSITLGPAGANALGLESKTYGGQVEITRDLNNAASGTSIEIGFGSGKPSDLAKLGIRTAAYLRGTVADDVLAFVTDASGSVAKVSAGYSGEPAPLAQSLRAQPMDIEIIAGAPAGLLRYRITDLNTQTVMAERDLDPQLLDTSQPGGGIVFQGLSVSFTSTPKVGDRFLLDGNKDGTGNNDNMRALTALESAKLIAGTKTIGSAYVDHVNNMGNIARQATIAQDALTVMRDQAVESRDKVSGVNLDEEAANLIRFQQAYQASAKVMQTASQLFDAMLQIA
jgi:flagellar hook-associated protein FlgK